MRETRISIKLNTTIAEILKSIDSILTKKCELLSYRYERFNCKSLHVVYTKYFHFCRNICNDFSVINRYIEKLSKTTYMSSFIRSKFACKNFLFVAKEEFEVQYRAINELKICSAVRFRRRANFN